MVMTVYAFVDPRHPSAEIPNRAMLMGFMVVAGLVISASVEAVCVAVRVAWHRIVASTEN